ncbi:MAG TPA: glutaminyl-peptide cyclotransferase [Chitinophagaceae bacterium]|jgi:glutamine cyclotransferase|nr:glutaminyl-peptide cyclotransferase [Chitinophagaceae bacterium]
MKKITYLIAAIIIIGVGVYFIFFNKEIAPPTPPPPPAPPILNCIPQRSYPHDTSSFTEGLLIYNGSLYESTGNKGKSKLLKINLTTGKAEKEVKLDSIYFGEGIAILRDTIYQLTYQEHVAFVYTVKDLKKIKQLPFSTESGEGWGMTTDGTYLIATDGSSNLYYYEPSTFKLVKKLTVTDAGTLSYNVNELEWIDGYIYANQWQLPYILKIDPSNGQVVAKVDLTDLLNRIKQKDPHAEVLNGIAYDSASKKIYVTGKWWPELYEVQFQ